MQFARTECRIIHFLRHFGFIGKCEGPGGGRAWVRFGVKIEVAPVWLNVGARAGFHVGGAVAHLFLDLRSEI